MNTIATFGEGRLGNQMFQAALLLALARRRGHDFYLARGGETLWDGFDLDVPSVGPVCQHRFDEVYGSCNYDPRVFQQPADTAFHGYFQSHRYLAECRAALIGFFRFQMAHTARCEAMLYALRRRHHRPLVSLHVRRGDYLLAGGGDHWGNLAADGYYQRALDAIGGDVTCLVFSDDLDWCRRSLHLDVDPDHLLYADFDHFTCLRLMTGCDVNIIANSTFSWWGAYLNPHSEVYAPRRWWRAIPPPNDRQDDICPPEWRTIPTFAGSVPESSGRAR